MKIGIVVHGRFHAFDLVHGLTKRGHDVVLFTNYPAWAVARFRLPTSMVRSFAAHGAISRLWTAAYDRARVAYPDRWLHPMFGRWATRQLMQESWDVVHSWSGVSEEILQAMRDKPVVNLLLRGSAHIRAQSNLLRQEESRLGLRLEKPSQWMVEREEREYALADRIIVLSTFSYQSFLTRGFTDQQLRLLQLGARVAAFRPPAEVMAERVQRILSHQPLRVLFVGAVSFRKGFWDLTEIVRSFSPHELHVRCVGPVTAEARPLVRKLSGLIEFIPKQPQDALISQYAWGDVFLFPTVEDGYAQVLAQARAAGLPILTTTNCAGPDLIRTGETGWVLPIRSPQAFVEVLHWCNGNRAELAMMARNLMSEQTIRNWDDVAADFEAICLDTLAEIHATPAAVP